MTIVPPFQDDAKGIDKQDSEETREFVKDLILTELQDFLSSEGLKKLVDQFTRSLLNPSLTKFSGFCARFANFGLIHFRNLLYLGNL